MLIASAETYVRESEDALNKEKPSYMLAAGYLQNAIEAYRRVGGQNARITELHRKLLEYQKLSMEEMGQFSSGPLDVSDYVENSRKAVEGKFLGEALITLSRICTSPKVSDLRKYVEEKSRKFPFQHLLSTVAVNESGKVVAREPAMISDNPAEVEAAKRAEMYKHAALNQSMQAQACIEPARNQILSRQRISLCTGFPRRLNRRFYCKYAFTDSSVGELNSLYFGAGWRYCFNI